MASSSMALTACHMLAPEELAPEELEATDAGTHPRFGLPLSGLARLIKDMLPLHHTLTAQKCIPNLVATHMPVPQFFKHLSMLF